MGPPAGQWRKVAAERRGNVSLCSVAKQRWHFPALFPLPASSCCLPSTSSLRKKPTAWPRSGPTDWQPSPSHPGLPAPPNIWTRVETSRQKRKQLLFPRPPPEYHLEEQCILRLSLNYEKIFFHKYVRCKFAILNLLTIYVATYGSDIQLCNRI